MERQISVYIEAKDERMVSQTRLPPMWVPPMWVKPPSTDVSKQPTNVMVLSSMEIIQAQVKHNLPSIPIH